MRIIIAKDYAEMSQRAARIVASHIILKPNSSIGLATGSTPLGMYNALIELYKEGYIDLSNVTTFNLDEYYGVRPTNPQSYHYYMYNNFFKHINIGKANVNIPYGMCKSIEDECNRYEEKIEEVGGIDLQVLGIGRNGHIGFNEPDIKFEAKTHMVNLDEDTIKANSRFFHSIEEVPRKAISMGIKTIMRAKKVLLLAVGLDKANVVFQMLYGKITPELPASILQLHPDVTMIFDKEAASLLEAMKNNKLKEFSI